MRKCTLHKNSGVFGFLVLTCQYMGRCIYNLREKGTFRDHDLQSYKGFWGTEFSRKAEEWQVRTGARTLSACATGPWENRHFGKHEEPVSRIEQRRPPDVKQMTRKPRNTESMEQ